MNLDKEVYSFLGKTLYSLSKNDEEKICIRAQIVLDRVYGFEVESFKDQWIRGQEFNNFFYKNDIIYDEVINNLERLCRYMRDHQNSHWNRMIYTLFLQPKPRFSVDFLYEKAMVTAIANQLWKYRIEGAERVKIQAIHHPDSAEDISFSIMKNGEWYNVELKPTSGWESWQFWISDLNDQMQDTWRDVVIETDGADWIAFFDGEERNLK